MGGVNKALILAAGLGSRLLENTKDLPKCLVRVGGKPILEYQLEAISANGINEIVIVTGHCGHKIRKFIESHPKFKSLNVKYVENNEYDSSNSSYSFWLAKDYVKNEPYLHFNCDIIFDKDLLKKVIESEHPNVIVIDKGIKLTKHMEQVVMDGSKIKVMEKQNLENSHGKAIGIAKFSPENVSWIIEKLNEFLKKGDKNQNYYGIIRRAVHHKEFFGMDSAGHLQKEVNTVEDLKAANEALENGKGNNI